ncbi:spore protease YyaC [Paenibacillus sp. GSMTC-2017]|uniref:spore protease YyaC n=1 Tax=Paenibacillus sp. GSMTC-2017 TaxID=2794350 RepID=UPI0018D696B7|nr:spore protease YyaC [Paenibacillus sp. GSMTC-2017]MBH5319311.1 spore protease YyaC [Paenibacillus sp. GSMTC-2017]
MKLPFMRDVPFKLPYTTSNIIGLLVNRLTGFLQDIPTNRPIVVVCIGTDRSTGDALGPLIGTSLLKYRSPHFHLYGTLENPVHAMNLEETLLEINDKHASPFVIGIDACLGQVASVGCIQVAEGPVRPGAGVNKDLPPVGDIHVTGIVNVGGFMEYFVLQNTRLHLVMRLSEIIATSLFTAIANHIHISSTVRDQTAASDHK